MPDQAQANFDREVADIASIDATAEMFSMPPIPPMPAWWPASDTAAWIRANS